MNMTLEDFEIGNKLSPSKTSPFINSSYVNDDFELTGKDDRYLIILRNGHHTFTSLPCYFIKKN